MASTDAAFTKQRAARQQLEVAIYLFFVHAELLAAVHTLAAAALALSRDILRADERSYTLDLEKWLRPGMSSEWRKIANKQANFLKHADRDPAAILSMNDEQTKYQLLEAVDAYHTLYDEITLPMKLYQAWFAHSYPSFFSEMGWGGFTDLFQAAGFGPGDFTRQSCGDLLLLIAARSEDSFGQRCLRLFADEGWCSTSDS